MRLIFQSPNLFGNLVGYTVLIYLSSYFTYCWKFSMKILNTNWFLKNFVWLYKKIKPWSTGRGADTHTSSTVPFSRFPNYYLQNFIVYVWLCCLLFLLCFNVLTSPLLQFFKIKKRVLEKLLCFKNVTIYSNCYPICTDFNL